MKRLTERDGTFVEYLTNKATTTHGAIKRDDACTQKLCRLENIEEELGIELDILFKSIKDGFVVRRYFDWDYCRCFVNGTDITIDYDGKKFTNNYSDDWYFNDYGKTWALTKEELANE